MFIVIESTPGYLPDADEPAEFAEFNTYADAVAYANELANELTEQGYDCDRSWTSSQNTYAVRCQLPDSATVAPDLGRYIEVLDAELIMPTDTDIARYEAEYDRAHAWLTSHTVWRIDFIDPFDSAPSPDFQRTAFVECDQPHPEAVKLVWRVRRATGADTQEFLAAPYMRNPLHIVRPDAR